MQAMQCLVLSYIQLLSGIVDCNTVLCVACIQEDRAECLLCLGNTTRTAHSCTACSRVLSLHITSPKHQLIRHLGFATINPLSGRKGENELSPDVQHRSIVLKQAVQAQPEDQRNKRACARKNHHVVRKTASEQ